VLILPGISPFIGSTEAEARALHEEFNELTQPAYSLDLLHRMLGVRLEVADLDRPVPRELIENSGERALGSRFQVILDIIDRERPTVRRLLHRLAGARGHRVVAGTPEKIADQIQRWFENGAADGFNVMPPWLAGGFDAFADEVLPILRGRGLFRTEYAGTTLREHYGLPRPASRYARGAADGTAQAPARAAAARP
jgi:alkanesulfonate monooxygenase SsuD/methylene tetrahydromethanopterin reductase-like flavin-dependent oxidoreductase (luciferase family)